MCGCIIKQPCSQKQKHFKSFKSGKEIRCHFQIPCRARQAVRGGFHQAAPLWAHLSVGHCARSVCSDAGRGLQGSGCWLFHSPDLCTVCPGTELAGTWMFSTSVSLQDAKFSIAQKWNKWSFPAECAAATSPQRPSLKASTPGSALIHIWTLWSSKPPPILELCTPADDQLIRGWWLPSSGCN